MMKQGQKMSEFRLSFPACVVAGKNGLTAEDTVLLRKYTFPDGVRSPDDVVTILALSRLCPEQCEEWRTYFVESLAGYIIHHCYPTGTLDEINVAWIESVFATRGIIWSAMELELVLHVIEISPHVPPALTVLALDQLQHAIAGGDGAYRSIRGCSDNRVTEFDLRYIHRVLRHAFDGNGLRLTEREADAMRRIDAAASPGASHPDWHDLVAAAGCAADRKPAQPAEKRWLRVPDAFFLDAEMSPDPLADTSSSLSALPAG